MSSTTMNSASNSAYSVVGRVALVTGGGTGIGRAAALALAKAGADVVLAGRRPEPLEAVADEIKALGRRALAVPTDVSVSSLCDALIATTVETFGSVDILVNCAGGGKMMPIHDWSDDDWRQIIDLNLSSAWWLSRGAARHMLAKGSGSIVNISSGASLTAQPTAAIYGAAKAGMNSITRSMAAAWTPEGVRVNAIIVGAVRAPTLVDEMDRLCIDVESVGQMNAMGRLGDPDEIGNTVLYFASDASSFCSGQTLYVNGGPRNGGI